MDEEDIIRFYFHRGFGINSVSDALYLIDSLRSVISNQDNDQVNK